MRRLAVAWAAAAVLLPSVASAQDDIVVPTQTQFNLYQEGAEAYAAEEYSKAVDLFRASLRLGELNITYLNLGRALFKLGDCQEASAAYAKALTAPKIANPTPMQVLTKVEEYKRDLTGCPATLTVECDDVTAQLWVDGTGPVPCDGAAMTVLPGDHKIEARLADEVRRESVALAAMESRTVPLLFRPGMVVGPAGPTPPVIAATNADQASRVRVGAAVALVATGSADVEVDSGEESSREQDTDESQYAINVFAGYRVTGGLVLGVGIWYLPSYKLVDEDQGETIGDATQLDANVVALYEFPVGALVPFVVLEGGFSSVEDDDNDTTHTGLNFGGGAGARFHFSETFAVGADVRFTRYDVGSSVDLASDFNFTGDETDFDISDFESTNVDFSVTGTRVLVNLGATLTF